MYESVYYSVQLTPLRSNYNACQNTRSIKYTWKYMTIKSNQIFD